MTASSQNASQLFLQFRAGDEGAMEQLFPLVYEEIRALARRYMGREYGRQTLQTTDLVHEAYLRLIPDRNLQWNDKAHFLALVARSMRQILVERARARHAQKRGGRNARPVSIHDDLLGKSDQTVDVLALEEALDRLESMDPRQARLVELRFYGGLTVEEAAGVLEISTATVKRDWSFAQTWLRSQLSS